MAGPVVVAAAEPADEGTILLDQDPTPSSAGTAEPGTQALLTTEGPLFLDLHDLGFIAVGEGDFRMTPKTSNPDTWMVLQELTVAPFPWST